MVDAVELTTKLRDCKIAYYESVSAGFASPADDYLEENLSLDRYLIKNPSTTFFLRVEGMSMIGAGIYPNDILIVDKSLRAKNKDVIVAVLAGEFTLKRFIKNNDRYFLKAENKQYPTMEITGREDFQVWGVVTAVIHNPKEL